MKWRWLPLSTRSAEACERICGRARPCAPAASRIVGAGAGEHRPVAVVEIGDAVGERRQRQRVGAEIHLAVAVADRQRRAAAGADQQVVARPRTGRPARRRRRAAAASRGHRLDRRRCRRSARRSTRWATTSVSVSVSKTCPSASSSRAQLAEILDDAVVDHRHALGGVRMGVALGRRAVGGPAGVADADGAGERLGVQRASRLPSLPSARRRAMCPPFQRGDAGRIIAAVFEPLQRLDQPRGDRLPSQNADDSAHD